MNVYTNNGFETQFYYSTKELDIIWNTVGTQSSKILLYYILHILHIILPIYFN